MDGLFSANSPSFFKWFASNVMLGDCPALRWCGFRSARVMQQLGGPRLQGGDARIGEPVCLEYARENGNSTVFVHRDDPI
ncbi:hypothetical protein [Paraburkholderia strydomiana]|uniref:hypothetical protein n=1 Tax=Paraburkholderia strydomiana TaxID=1245417 RepID=UPI001BEC4D7A|nr:hypothetical protein [Paraburkholderia strydomiana]MBT2790112.1 hypothetical protein [Paraburkholderia strydomiana]